MPKIPVVKPWKCVPGVAADAALAPVVVVLHSKASAVERVVVLVLHFAQDSKLSTTFNLVTLGVGKPTLHMEALDGGSIIRPCSKLLGRWNRRRRRGVNSIIDLITILLDMFVFGPR